MLQMEAGFNEGMKRDLGWEFPAVEVNEWCFFTKKDMVEILTISVSDTGPKLVTKMLVFISVTFSVKSKTNCNFFLDQVQFWSLHT